MSDERTPLLQSSERAEDLGDHHVQFSQLIGIRPHNLASSDTFDPNPLSLYSRAVAQRNSQKFTYMFTATLVNTLILSQVVLGAAITGLGASDSSHILITVFGALNTVIAGIIAFMKSRGQPMRARMFKDDLERVVDEIENSAMMWLGISKGHHGYDAIDTDEQVTVRSEVARLTRLYDKAVKTNTLNDPDMYATGGPGDLHSAALRDKSAVAVALPAGVTIPSSSAAAVVSTVAAGEYAQDASPATKPPEPDKAVATESSTKEEQQESTGSAAAVNDDGGQTTSNERSTAKTSNGGDAPSPGTSKEHQEQRSEPVTQSSPAKPFDPDASPASTADP